MIENRDFHQKQMEPMTAYIMYVKYKLLSIFIQYK